VIAAVLIAQAVRVPLQRNHDGLIDFKSKNCAQIDRYGVLMLALLCTAYLVHMGSRATKYLRSNYQAESETTIAVHKCPKAC
jgi:hypothetical protein